MSRAPADKRNMLWIKRLKLAHAAPEALTRAGARGDAFAP